MGSSKVIGSEVDTSTEAALRLEYEQIVQTLRNWDTIFAGWFSSLLIGGGIGTVASFVGKEIDPATFAYAFKVISTSVLLIAAVMGGAYLTYSSRVASKKKAVLIQIEKSLGMAGSYRQVGSVASRALMVTLGLPLAVGLIGIALIWIFVK